jgi:RNA polymerase sigma-70 factor (ECF subfamily)
MPPEPAHPLTALDAGSRRWLERLRTAGSVRDAAVDELYELLRHEASFHIRARAAPLVGFPRSDIEDLATQAAGDALVAILRKLDDYRGDARFWSWARRFAEIEAAVSVRRRLGHDRVGISLHPERMDDVVDPAGSPHDRAEARELLRTVGEIMATQLTGRQRSVLAAAIDGVPAVATARRLETSPGAVHKCLHDARLKVRSSATP